MIRGTKLPNGVAYVSVSSTPLAEAGETFESTEALAEQVGRLPVGVELFVDKAAGGEFRTFPDQESLGQFIARADYPPAPPPSFDLSFDLLFDLSLTGFDDRPSPPPGIGYGKTAEEAAKQAVDEWLKLNG